jgi:Cu2+-exporting ATPase
VSAVLQAVACFHCGLPAPPGASRPVVIDGAAQPMCCPGCAAVAQAIVDIGQTEYYRNRSEFAATRAGATLVPPALALYDLQGQDFVHQNGNSLEATLSVEGIRCAACVWLIERQLALLPGIQAASMNVATERLFVRWDSAQCQPSAIFAAIGKVGYNAYPFDAQRHGEQLARASKALSRRLFVAGLAMMQVMMYAVPAYLADDGTLEAPMAALMQWASLLLTLPVMAYSALPFYRGAWSGLKARAPGMDVPVVLGIGAAFAASVLATLRGQGEVYFDSVTMFVFLLLCSRYLELGARRKAATALERILNALPQAALRMAGFPASRATQTVAAASLQKDDVILVKAGDAFAADGTIAEGDTSIDLSLLSGESEPQRRVAGDSVAGGAVNIGAPVALRVARPVRDSTLSELIRLTQRAGVSKPKLSTWADLVASRFVVLLLVFAACVFGAWQWIDPGRAWPIAIAVLVVSCPCALSLAMPTVMAAATDKLLRRGVLVVQAHTLETLHRATHIVFDKTGTLTLGKPRLHTLGNTGVESDDACLSIAAAIEAGSSHPLAQAIVAAAGPHPLPLAAQVQEAPGRGMQAQVNGVCYRVGSADYVAELTGEAGWPQSALPAPAGATVFLGCAGQLLAGMRFSDGVRDDAAATVRAFQQAGKEVILLSGDQSAAAREVGSALGIAQVHGGYLPEQKLDFVRQLQQQGAVVAMVGDGINDAAVLSAADVSFAMGSGAALAQVNADCVLLSGRIGSLEEAARLAASSMRIVRQNLAWATVYNLIAIPAAALGLITPWMSGLGMTASSALVVLNALRARR